jgi:hypothetical protein
MSGDLQFLIKQELGYVEPPTDRSCRHCSMFKNEYFPGNSDVPHGSCHLLVATLGTFDVSGNGTCQHFIRPGEFQCKTNTP